MDAMTTEIMTKLEEIAALTRAAAIPFSERYIDASEIAAMLHFKPRYVAEVLTKRPDFPTPLRVDGTGHPRWKAADISLWASNQRSS